MQFFSKSVTVVKSRRIQGTSTYMMVLSWKNSKIKFDDANGAPNSVTCNMSVMFHLDLLDAFIQAVRRMGWLGFENYWNSCEKNFFLVEIGSVLKTGIKNHIVATDTSFEKLWGIACQNISEKSFKPYNAEELAVAEAKKDTSGGIIESKKEIYANCVADEVIEIEPAITTKSKESV